MHWRSWIVLAVWKGLATAHTLYSARSHLSSHQHSVERVGHSDEQSDRFKHDFGKPDGCPNYDELNKTLYPLAFKPLPLGTIKPRGWMKQQLSLMADGLPGHMHEFYRLVRNATWGGGKVEYSELNEAWPYYINGLVPLAYSIDNPSLRDEVDEQISYVLLRQFPDGWLGPEEDELARNFWGRYPFFLAAAQYVEAIDPPKSQKILSAMHRFVDLMYRMLRNDHQGYVWKRGDHFSQGNEQWGRSRAADMILTLQWLYENYPGVNHKKIHQCMFMLYEKAYDWSWWFRDDIFLKDDIESYPPELIDPLFPFLHGVNAAQGLKSPAVMGRLLHDVSLFDSSRRGVELSFEYHGTSTGAIIGDERMSSNSPNRGVELCSVVETMFSLSTLFQLQGDGSFIDRLEKAAFNALPAMVMPKWWSHQYISQTNQPYAYEVPNAHFSNVGPWGLIFGLQPNYPCCTVNFPQGYTKLVSSSWVKIPKDNGLAHVVLIASEVRVVLEQNGRRNHVYIVCDTNYPFTQLLQYHVEADEEFSFSFHVPNWVDFKDPETGIYLDASGFLTTHNNAQQPLHSAKDPQPLRPDRHTGLHTVYLPAGPLSFTVYLSPGRKSSRTKPVVHNRPNSAVALTHGALVFAYSLHGDYTARRPSEYQNPGDAPPEAQDWTIVPRLQEAMPHDNQTTDGAPRMLPWNIAIDPDTAQVYEYENLYSSPDCADSHNEHCYDDWPNPIWSEFAPPISIIVMTCEIEWPLTAPVQYEDVGGPSRRRAARGGFPVPPPVPGKFGHKCVGRAFPIELRPYGSVKIRMAEFPTVDLSPGSHNLYGRGR